MSTYSVRCRVSSCRHRRVITRHPDSYIRVPRCSSCGGLKGWRIEQRQYNRRNLCACGQSPLYPHRIGKYKFCDFHPRGPYNQAKRRGLSDDDIPVEFHGKRQMHLAIDSEVPLEMMGRPMSETEDCPF